MTDRLTRWEGRDENGDRAVMVDRSGPFHEAFQAILRKLAKYEDMEEERAMNDYIVETIKRCAEINGVCWECEQRGECQLLEDVTDDP